MTEYGFQELCRGKSAFDFVLEYSKGTPDTESVIVLCDSDFPVSRWPEVDTIHDNRWSVSKLTSWLCKLSEGFDNLFFLYGDTPLLDTAKTREMYANHLKYFAQYSFADGYPQGLTPEIIESKAMKAIARLAADDEASVERNSIFETLKKDINAFDIETDIAAADQRLLRVTLAADTRRNTLLLRRMTDDGVSDMGAATEYLDAKPEHLRTLPAFFNVQIEEGCPQACSYCPWPVIHGDVRSARGEMSIEHFTSILEKISDFSEDATISVSLWGEPALHSGIEKLAAAVTRFDGLSLLIETSGVGWREGVIDNILESGGSRTEWIVSLDALTPELYTDFRGDGLKEATATALYLIEHAGKMSHVQAVRMKAGESELQDFYRFWKKHTDNIIIQKYDFFSGLLEPRKVTDLSPLKRFPCWHLKRDLNILLDGTVPVCREDLKVNHPLGNIFTDSLEEIWSRGEEWYLKHIREDYPQLCVNCDEYYTYNF